MSEYPGIRKTNLSIEDLDNRGTLFETVDELDRVVDTQNVSYYEARRRMGREDSSHTARDTSEVPELVVSLDERAYALNAIMEYLNKANSTNGSRVHIDHGGQQMRQRYGEPGVYDVQEGAEVNRDKLRSGFFGGIKILAAVEQMRANGFSEDDIESQRMAMQIEMNKEFGVAKAYAAKRHKAVNDATRVADYVNGRKKPRRRPSKP